MFRELREAKERYVQGYVAALNDIVELSEKLIEFYPDHTVKEDKQFFTPAAPFCHFICKTPKPAPEAYPKE